MTIDTSSIEGLAVIFSGLMTILAALSAAWKQYRKTNSVKEALDALTGAVEMSNAQNVKAVVKATPVSALAKEALDASVAKAEVVIEKSGNLGVAKP